ncbi:MAG TPA: sigma-70 family RNA polymerase sigma factor [Planktothrix sp.]
MLFRSRRKEFEKLTWPLSNELYRLAYWRLGNQQDAEDVLQDTYLRAFRSFHTFQKGTNLKGWMTRILLNVVSDTLKKRARQPDLLTIEEDCDEILNLQDPSASSKNPENQLIEREVRPDLLDALQRLPSSLLQPLLLRELEDMTYSDISAILGIPVGTVMSRLFRARRVLRDRLTQSIANKSEVADRELQ